jgi:hypothetical protein
MRFIIMHKTNAQWEAGAIPAPELIARVGKLIGDLMAANAFRAGEGLRASSQGARVRSAGGKVTVTPGPFTGGNEVPAGFTILRGTLDEAIQWASKAAESMGDAEIDVRPLTEPWDIGMAPKPAGIATRRYMALSNKSAPASLAAERVRPGRRGRRYKNAGGAITWTDGPFQESKELVGGYVIVEAGSLEDAARWARRYIEDVGAEEVDILELED